MDIASREVLALRAELAMARAQIDQLMDSHVLAARMRPPAPIIIQRDEATTAALVAALEQIVDLSSRPGITGDWRNAINAEARAALAKADPERFGRGK